MFGFGNNLSEKDFLLIRRAIAEKHGDNSHAIGGMVMASIELYFAILDNEHKKEYALKEVLDRINK